MCHLLLKAKMRPSLSTCHHHSGASERVHWAPVHTRATPPIIIILSPTSPLCVKYICLCHVLELGRTEPNRTKEKMSKERREPSQRGICSVWISPTWHWPNTLPHALSKLNRLCLLCVFCFFKKNKKVQILNCIW